MIPYCISTGFLFDFVFCKMFYIGLIISYNPIYFFMNAALEVTLTLECIDGKDDHYKVDIGEGEKLILGQHSDGADNKLVCFLHPKTTNSVLIELCQEK